MSLTESNLPEHRYDIRPIKVSEAGDSRVNGIYFPVVALPSGDTDGLGPLIWRHGNPEDSELADSETKNCAWIHIMHGEDYWWIGHFDDCTEDLYYTIKVKDGPDDAIVNDPHRPPVDHDGMWHPCLHQDPEVGLQGEWFKGCHPAPKVEWADGFEEYTNEGLSEVIRNGIRAPEDEYQSIEVYGAGDERVNGIYIPVKSLPRKGYAVGPLKWRKQDSDWIYIMNTEGSWWIGHFANCTEDLYCTYTVVADECGANNHMRPPVDLPDGCWQACLKDDPSTEDENGEWFKGVEPAPKLRFCGKAAVELV